MKVSAETSEPQGQSMKVGTKIDEIQGKHVNERKSVPGQNSIGKYVRPIESNRHRNRLAGSAWIRKASQRNNYDFYGVLLREHEANEHLNGIDDFLVMVHCWENLNRIEIK